MAPSRWPTQDELRGVLDALDGYDVSYRNNADGGWDAEIVDHVHGYEGMSASIWTKRCAADAPCPFQLHKPHLELAMQILERLSHGCGPFALLSGLDMRAVVVTANRDVSRLVDELIG